CAARRVDHRRAAPYCDTLRKRAHFEAKILLDVILEVDDDTQEVYLFETRLVDCDLVLPGLDIREHINSRVVRGSRHGNAAVNVLELNFRTRNDRTRVIRNQPRDSRGLGLRKRRSGAAECRKQEYAGNSR